jgi:DNA-binding winged helix-turn-helix (wHTH) protein/tetratricopeptide (TPR) repeat protein
MSTSGLANRDFRVADVLARPRLARIQRGDETVRVTPRAMAVLVHLAEANGAVVSRNDLLDAIWPKMAVTPDALSQCLVELRRAFGDDAKSPRTIETIRGIGVRLIAPVTVEEAAEPQRPMGTPTWLERASDASRTATHESVRNHEPRRLWRVVAAIVAAIVASGAALLFWPAERSELATDERARLRDVPTTSTRAHEFYLSGNEYWRRNNDPHKMLRLIVQQYTRATEEDPGFALAWARLAIAHTGLYFRSIDRTPARLALADAALRVAFELAPALPEAHLAKAAFLGRGLGDYAGALAELVVAEPGLREDPDFYYLRAGLYMHLGEWERSLADHDSMLQLDPRNVVYLRQRSQVEISMHDYEAAERTLDRILELAPDDGTAYVDRVFLALYAHGDTTLANRYERSPPSASYSTALASTYVRWLAAVFDGDYTRALSVLDGSSEEPVFDGDLRNSFSPKSLLYARSHLLAGRPTEAMRYLQRAKGAIEQQLTSPQSEGEPSALLQVALAEVQAALGDREGALALLAGAGDVASAMQRSAMQLAVAVRVLVPLGEHGRALEELDGYLSSTGKWTIEGLLADPRLDPLHSDPRFAALVAKHKHE